MHKGFGRAAAWQFWYDVARRVLPKPAEYDYDEEPAGNEVQDVTAALLWEAFEQLWQRLSVRTWRLQPAMLVCGFGASKAPMIPDFLLPC